MGLTLDKQCESGGQVNIMVSIDLDTITAEEVIAAYKETGLVPDAGRFLTTAHHDPECKTGCSIGAVAWQQGVDLSLFEVDNFPLPDNWMSFALGFDLGFTGGNPDLDYLGTSYQSRYRRGFDIGQAVRQWWREEVENERD